MSAKQPLFHEFGVIGWRRNDLWGASQNAARAFAAVNIIVVLWNALAFQTANFEAAFWIGLSAGLGYGVVSMIFKTSPVFDK